MVDVFSIGPVGRWDVQSSGQSSELGLTVYRIQDHPGIFTMLHPVFWGVADVGLSTTMKQGFRTGSVMEWNFEFERARDARCIVRDTWLAEAQWTVQPGGRVWKHRSLVEAEPDSYSATCDSAHRDIACHAPGGVLRADRQQHVQHCRATGWMKLIPLNGSSLGNRTMSGKASGGMLNWSRGGFPKQSVAILKSFSPTPVPWSIRMIAVTVLQRKIGC